VRNKTYPAPLTLRHFPTKSSTTRYIIPNKLSGNHRHPLHKRAEIPMKIIHYFYLSALLMVTYTSATMVTYCPKGIVRLNCVQQLSDGTLLVGGQATSLEGIAQSIPRTQLSAEGLNSASTGNIGILMHLSGDGKTILRLAHFAPGTARDVYRIRTTNIPGEPTGDIYFSGNRDVSDSASEGYYIARLNANFVSAPPTATQWVFNVGDSTLSDFKKDQPWDVDNQGSVIYGQGKPFHTKWAAIYKIDKYGKPATVPFWRNHWYRTPLGEVSEFGGLLKDFNLDGTPFSSGIVLKNGRGSLRSWTKEDYERELTDANGGKKRGTWPNDYYYKGPKGINDSVGGYTGYRPNGTWITARVGAITIDRRTNHLYFGYSVKSKLPDGNPDFEPAVVAMDHEGALKWWSRCYPEWIDNNNNGILDAGDTKTSTPDQYIDGLSIDYSAPAGGALVVVARCHGNNTINFWRGNKISYATNPGSSFQHQFTGTNGNIHISWIGRFSLDKEQIRHATYLAEVNEGQNPGGSYSSPLLQGWFNLNSGWADLNTTKVRPNSVACDEKGSVYVAAVGRRTITTSNAFQQNLKPGEGVGCWNNFVRVYKADLTLPLYSSLLVGAWNTTDGSGGGNVELMDICAKQGGLVTVGYHQAAADGSAKLNPMPTANRPSWGEQTPSGESAVLAVVDFDNSSSTRPHI
jgi:hypothetical protein